jgi:molecular chaperone GrpE
MPEDIEKEPKKDEETEPEVRDQEEADSSDAEETGEVSIEALKAQHYKEKSELKEKMLRIAAEFDNYKKRMQRDIREREERARADVLKGILPMIDNIHRAVEHAGKASDIDSVVDGVRIAERNFLETLAKLGVKRLESRPFTRPLPSSHPGSFPREPLPRRFTRASC